MSTFFKGYRSTALPPDAIIASIRIPVLKPMGEYMRAYKQAKRKDDDIAIVNAALRVTLSEEHVVRSADLVYGGMAPTTIAAKKTMRFLLGKRWLLPETLEGAMNALEEDFDLRFGVPGGKSELYSYYIHHVVALSLVPTCPPGRIGCLTVLVTLFMTVYRATHAGSTTLGLSSSMITLESTYIYKANYTFLRDGHIPQIASTVIPLSLLS